MISRDNFEKVLAFAFAIGMVVIAIVVVWTVFWLVPNQELEERENSEVYCEALGKVAVHDTWTSECCDVVTREGISAYENCTEVHLAE